MTDRIRSDRIITDTMSRKKQKKRSRKKLLKQMNRKQGRTGKVAGYTN